MLTWLGAEEHNAGICFVNVLDVMENLLIALSRAYASNEGMSNNYHNYS